MLMPRKMAPSGLPRCRRVCSCPVSGAPSSSDRDVFSRKSWVMATPMEAKERDVRSQARKVRSVGNEEKTVSARVFVTAWPTS